MAARPERGPENDRLRLEQRHRRDDACTRLIDRQ